MSFVIGRLKCINEDPGDTQKKYFLGRHLIHILPFIVEKKSYLQFEFDSVMEF